MGFSETRVQKSVLIGETFKHTFTYNGDKKITRINPVCKCVKFKVNHPNYTFWYTVKSNSLKVIVVTYNDDTKDFLELKPLI